MFPERLKQLRKEKGMTQIDLAKAIGVSSGTIAMWETGKRKPSFEMFDRLTEVFERDHHDAEKALCRVFHAALVRPIHVGL